MMTEELLKWILGMIAGLMVGGVFVWVRGLSSNRAKNEKFREEMREFKGSVTAQIEGVAKIVDRIDDKIDKLPCKECGAIHGSDRIVKASVV